jgi:hypothetical protein
VSLCVRAGLSCNVASPVSWWQTQSKGSGRYTSNEILVRCKSLEAKRREYHEAAIRVCGAAATA